VLVEVAYIQLRSELMTFNGQILVISAPAQVNCNPF